MVLVDTEELYFNTTRKALSKVGIDLTRDLFVQISLRQGRSTFDLAAAQGVEQDVIDRLRTERNLSYGNLLPSGVRVLEGVEDTLCRLRGKVLMGVVTNSRREHFEIIHIATGLLHYFDFVLTREDYKKSKPDPGAFLAAIKRNGLKRQHCIIVEDSERGLAAAKAAEIRCIMIPNSLTKDGDFSGAYRVFSNAGEVAVEVLKLITCQIS